MRKEINTSWKTVWNLGYLINSSNLSSIQFWIKNNAWKLRWIRKENLDKTENKESIVNDDVIVNDNSKMTSKYISVNF
jgi:hypothetical protein